MKEKNEGRSSLKFKASASKDCVKRMKRQATDWEKIFANTYLIKDLYQANDNLWIHESKKQTETTLTGYQWKWQNTITSLNIYKWFSFLPFLCEMVKMYIYWRSLHNKYRKDDIVRKSPFCNL